jgi:hypothetical protein
MIISSYGGQVCLRTESTALLIVVPELKAGMTTLNVKFVADILFDDPIKSTGGRADYGNAYPTGGGEGRNRLPSFPQLTARHVPQFKQRAFLGVA